MEKQTIVALPARAIPGTIFEVRNPGNEPITIYASNGEIIRLPHGGIWSTDQRRKPWLRLVRWLRLRRKYEDCFEH